MPRRLALLPSVVLLAAAAVAAEPGTAPGDCLDPGSVLDAVRSGRARALAALRRDVDGDLLRADLCRDGGGRLVYRLTVLDPHGRVRRMRIDAGSGGLLYDEH